MDYEAGSAFVSVVPSFGGVVKQIAAQAEEWGDEAGKVFTDAFNDIVKEGTGSEIGPSDETSTRSGDSAGGKFADAFRARVDAALKTLPDGTVNLNDEEAEAKLADIRARLETLRNLNIGIDIKDTDALAALSVLKADLDELGAKSPSIRVKVDTAAAVTELEAVRVAADSAGGSGGGGSGVGGLFGLGEEADSLGGSFGSMGTLLTGFLATGLIPLGGAAAGVAGAFGAMATEALAGGGAFALAAAGSGELTYALDLGKAAVSSWAAQFKPEITQVFGDALDTLLVVLQDLNPLVDAGAKAIDAFFKSAGNVAESSGFKSFIAFLASQVGPVMKTMGTAFISVGSTLAKMMEQAAPLMPAFENALLGIVNSLAKWVDSGGFESFLKWLQKNGPSIFNDVKNVASAVGQMLAALAPVGMAALGFAGFLGKLATAKGIWASFANDVLDPLRNWFTQTIPHALSVMSGTFTTAWQSVHNIANTVWHTVDNDVLHPLENWFTQSVPHAMSVFSGAISGGFQSVHNILNTVWHSIDNDVFHPIENFFTVTIPGALNTAVGFFSALPGRIGGALSSLFGVISRAFGNVASFVTSNVISPVVNLFSALPGDIGHAVGAAISGLSSIGKDLIDDIIRGINDGINLINSHIPSILGHKIFPSIPDIPMLATGGPVMPGLPYLVGEAGPELFVPSVVGDVLSAPQTAAALAPVSAISPPAAGYSSPVPNLDLASLQPPSPGTRIGLQVGTVVNNDNADFDVLMRKVSFALRAGQL